MVGARLLGWGREVKFKQGGQKLPGADKLADSGFLLRGCGGPRGQKKGGNTLLVFRIGGKETRGRPGTKRKLCSDAGTLMAFWLTMPQVRPALGPWRSPRLPGGNRRWLRKAGGYFPEIFAAEI